MSAKTSVGVNALQDVSGVFHTNQLQRIDIPQEMCFLFLH